MEKPKLTRKKIGDRNYNLVTDKGVVVGSVVMTGEYGRDHYPWDWSLSDELYEQLNKSATKGHSRTQGVTSSMRDAVDIIASLIAQHHLTP